jgi:hypothetical protein
MYARVLTMCGMNARRPVFSVNAHGVHSDMRVVLDTGARFIIASIQRRHSDMRVELGSALGSALDSALGLGG